MSERNLGIEKRLLNAIERELLLGHLGDAAGTFSRVVHSRANLSALPSLDTFSVEDEAKLKAFAERLTRLAKTIQDISSGKS